MGIKYQLKITLGCLEIGKEGKKPRALLLVLCPAQPWRPLPLPFTGGLDGSWWTFPGNFSTFVSSSGFLSVQILSFAPKCAFFFPSKCLSHHLLHNEEQAGKGLWVRSQMGIGSFGETSLEFVLEIFF